QDRPRAPPSPARAPPASTGPTNRRMRFPPRLHALVAHVVEDLGERFLEPDGEGPRQVPYGPHRWSGPTLSHEAGQHVGGRRQGTQYRDGRTVLGHGQCLAFLDPLEVD